MRRTLRAESGMIGPTALPGARAEYGTLMQVWTRATEDGEREPLAFGHTGSDGTHAWVFPERRAMVLYFTQSRGTMSGLRVEERLGELLLGVPFDPLQAAPPLEQYLGYYWEGEGDLYRAIVRDGRDLALEIPGRAVVPLDYIGEDRWKLRPEPATVIAFDRGEDGSVTGYHIGDHQEFRVTPAPDLPSADEVATRVAAAHRLERLKDSGPVILRGRLDIPKLDRRGQTTTWLAWPDRWRVDVAIGEEFRSRTRTITETDVVNFASLSDDWSEVHISEQFAKGTAYGRRIAHGLLGLAITEGLKLRGGADQFAGIASLGWTWDGSRSRFTVATPNLTSADRVFLDFKDTANNAGYAQIALEVH